MCNKKSLLHKKFSIVLAVLLLAAALLCALIAREAPFDDHDSHHIFASSSEDPDKAFDTYMEELFRQEVSGSALTLHYTLQHPENYGITDYNLSLGSYSADDPAAAASFAENILHTLSAFSPESLSAENRLTLDVLTRELELSREGANFPYLDEPLRPSTGIQSELPILLAEYAFADPGDVGDYLQLLSGIPAYFSGICRYEEEKAEKGLFMADYAADAIIRQCSDFAASGENNYLIYTFRQRLKALPDLTENERKAYLAQNEALVLQKVLPAFQKLADTLRDLKGSGKNPAGLCALPGGKDYYEYLVREATGSTDSVEKLQERTEAQRRADLSRAAQLLKEQPQLEAETKKAAAPCEKPEEMLALLQNSIEKDFPVPPKCRSTVKYVDEAMEEYLAPAFYLSSPLDNPEDNSIYINRGNGYEGIRLFTTLAHEGFPGHLYQNVMFHSTSPALIRTLFSGAGYAEGWATYVELWSYRYAGLSPDAACLLALDQSAVLSLYATADMGIHHDGWSYTDTFQFFSEYGITDESAVREIFELIVEEPAHYLKYYIGCLEFLSLRSFAKEICGKDYSDRAFHEAVLKIGPAPFDIIRKYLPEYFQN